MQYNWKAYKWHIILVCSLLVLITAIFYKSMKPAAVHAEAPVIVIKSGMSSREIASLLQQKGIIKSELLFHMLVRLQGMENSLKAGEYAFKPDMSAQTILSMLANGDTVYCQFTIPEGYTVEQIAKLVEDKKLGNADKFKALARNYTPFDYMVNNRKGVVYKAEGYVFPNTYRVAKDITEEQLLHLMVTQFDKQFTAEMRERAAQMGLSVKDVVILASLVEKEARLERDRPVIAGVFLNRLKIGMPLQSCATIQYILGYPKEELSVQDTEIPSPYNTYLHMGLPPGPIANPGLASIKAVLYPAKTDYLYFVADKKGAHHFSKTYEEHLAMIEQVRK